MNQEIISYNTVTRGEIDFFRKEGYLILPGFISKAKVPNIRSEVMEIMRIIGLENSKLRQTTQYLANSLIDSIVNNNKLMFIAGQLLGGPSSVYMPFTAVKSSNGGGRFHFHQDNQYTEFDKPGLNFWFALDDMTPENGCLQIVPGSHTNGTYEADLSGDGDNHKKIKWEPENFVPIKMKKGDCIVFTRLTVHGSGPNFSEHPRVAYAVQFHRDDVRAKWNGNDWVLLKEKPRWNVFPVKRIVPLEQISLDGH